MKLYEINTMIEETMLRFIDQETGEINPEGWDELEQLQIMEQEKIESIALYVKNLTAEAEAIDAEEKKLKARKTVAKNQADRIKTFLSGYLQNKGMDQFKSARCAIGFRKSQAVEIQDEQAFIRWAKQGHDNFLRYEDPEPNKKALKEALDNGENIPYAAIQTNRNIQIR